jgi:ABC-type branched-subunit amino acid transport system substrate-binding protein
MPSFALVARDTTSGTSAIRTEVRNLAADQSVALIGPFDGQAVNEAGTEAASVGLPVISLSPRGSSGPSVFAIRHSAEDRARLLARHAYKAGVRDFALLAPQTSYGRAVGKAFKQEVEALGGAVVVEVTYAKNVTAFGDVVEKLKKPWSAIFVPDLASRLQLIAPALASANLHAMPRGRKSKFGRSIMLLSTAEGVSRGFLRSAGRYSWGAFLAPGFFPDRTDSRIAEFVSRYEAEFGSEPSAHEAYAFDAARVVRHATESGASTRAEVSRALATQVVPGLTGEIRFSQNGNRGDEGLLFQVQQPISGQYELKALR